MKRILLLYIVEKATRMYGENEERFVWPYISIYSYLWLYSPCGPLPPFQILNPYTVGRTASVV
jgi:hypothetical protein